MFVECLSTDVVTSSIFLKDEWIVLLVTGLYYWLHVSIRELNFSQFYNR